MSWAMQSEIEAKFLDVDHDEIRAKLKKLGAKLEHPMRLMRRELFDHPDNRYQKHHQSERLRIRDEGNKITVTYKKSRDDSDYSYEVETTVGSYEEIGRLLQAIGLHSYSYQESKRETWVYKDVEVVLDEWPWLNTYIEIEGPSEEAIESAAQDLGFDWSQARFGSTDTVYRHQYPKMTKQESIGDIPKVEFDKPVPKFFTDRL